MSLKWESSPSKKEEDDQVPGQGQLLERSAILAPTPTSTSIISTLNLEKDGETEEELKLREELNGLRKTIAERRTQEMEMCVSISTMKVVQVLPAALEAWAKKSFTPSNLDDLAQVFGDVIKMVMEEHRGAIDASLWEEFGNLVEGKCRDLCDPKLEQVKAAVSKFISSIKQKFRENRCFPVEAKANLEDIGGQELENISQGLEASFVEPAVRMMCQELISVYKSRNERILAAEKNYAGSIIEELLKTYNRELKYHMGDTFCLPEVLQAVGCALEEKCVLVLKETFPVSTSTGKKNDEDDVNVIQLIQNDAVQELRGKLKQALESYKTSNDSELLNVAAELNQDFEKIKKKCSKSVAKEPEAKVKSDGTMDLNWLQNHSEVTAQVKCLLKEEIQLRMYGNLPEESLGLGHWKNLQATLDKPLIFLENSGKNENMNVEKRKELMVSKVMEFYLGEMGKIVTRGGNGPYPADKLQDIHESLMEKCLEGFQKAVNIYGKAEDLQGEIDQLREKLSKLLHKYKMLNGLYMQKMRVEVAQLQTDVQNEYRRRMRKILMKYPNGLSERSLEHYHVQTMADLKKLMKAEMEKRKLLRIERFKGRWESVEKYVGLHLRPSVINTNQANLIVRLAPSAGYINQELVDKKPRLETNNAGSFTLAQYFGSRN